MMIKKRTASTAILLTLFLGSIFLFKIKAIITLILLATALSQVEVCGLLNDMKLPICKKFNLVLSMLFPIIILLTKKHDFVYIVFVFIIVTWCIFVGKNIMYALTTMFAFWYIPFNLHFFIKIVQESSYALGIIIWSVVVMKMSDVGGLIVGCSIGKHKFAPTVSPKKTIEGIFGGLTFAIVFGLLLRQTLCELLPKSFVWQKAIFSAIILTLVAVISDLFESLLKRHANAKDSGKSIPGIGGLLDLTDSLLLNAPLVYLLFR